MFLELYNLTFIQIFLNDFIAFNTSWINTRNIIWQYIWKIVSLVALTWIQWNLPMTFWVVCYSKHIDNKDDIDPNKGKEILIEAPTLNNAKTLNQL